MILPVHRIFLAREAADMRCGHNGLLALVRRLGFDVLQGDAFVFFNRKRDRVKVLLWTRGGLTLLYKQLARGRFFEPAYTADRQTAILSASDFSLLFEGANPYTVERAKLWEPQNVLTS